MKHKLINKNYKTPIGIVNCGLASNKPMIEFIENKTYKNGQSEILKTNNFQIELIKFKVKIPLYNGDSLTDSKGWIWRITKRRNGSETIQLNCNLIDFDTNNDFDIATGEHLDAIEASNNDWILHIGTEDGEMLNSRAKANDWFPERFHDNVEFYQSITDMNKDGFTTKIPALQLKERLHIQYICAYDKRSDNNEKINTWLAVDEFKDKLENWVGI